MRRFAADLRRAEKSGIKHWSVDMWAGFIDEDDGAPICAFYRPECGCLFGGAISAKTTIYDDFPTAIADMYPSFGGYYVDGSPAALISAASESGVDFSMMAEFIECTPDWALDEYERSAKEAAS
jgi:hypothetical protein